MRMTIPEQDFICSLIMREQEINMVSDMLKISDTIAKEMGADVELQSAIKEFIERLVRTL